MSAQISADLAKAAANTVKQIQGASKTPVKKKRTPKLEHGRQIFVFNHLQKNHMVYSLTRALKNNASLSQLPFNGKKTVPAALRKDLWHPFALINFAPKSGPIGLSVFQKLREYRKRHEHEWGSELMTDSDGKRIPKAKRGRGICDQKANSVADMAAILSRLNLNEAQEAKAEKGSRIGLIGEGTGEKVEVLWRDLKDAEFAETWSENVEHGLLEMHTNNRDISKRKIWIEEREKEAELAAKKEADLAAKKEAARLKKSAREAQT